MTSPSDLGEPSAAARLYDRIVLGHPLIVVLLTALVVGLLGYYIKDFKMDASSDSIVLENDRDLQYYDYTRQIFGSDDYIVVTVSPDEEKYPEGIFSESVINELAALVAEFEAMDSVASVTSILNVPLFSSPPVPLFSIAKDYRTIIVAEGDEGRKPADRALAEKEFYASPLYTDYLISVEEAEQKTTAIQVNFKAPGVEYDGKVHKAKYKEVIDARADLKRKKWALEEEAQGKRSAWIRPWVDIFGRWNRILPAEEHAELKRLDAEYFSLHAQNSEGRRVDIEGIRGIIATHRNVGEIHLGGVPMIMADIISYVQGDIITLGLGVLLFIFISLGALFRKLRWVLLPVVTCALPVAIMFGYLGLTGWQATIVSSNFPSIMLVIAMAMTMHVAVRYRELFAGNPDMSNRELILTTVRHVATPCLYTSLTTIVGFASLIVSRIPPVVDFGLMMSLGLAIAYIVCFVFFPAALMFFPKGKAPPEKLAKLEDSPVRIFATLTERHRATVVVVCVALFVFFAVGTSRLTVENRFIDYFKKDTEIYQGMTVIDERLGGTTPLEVVLEGDGDSYWLRDENRAKLRAIHQWLDDLPETGKVISPDTLVRILEQVTPPGFVIKEAFLKQVLNGLTDESIRSAVITPYASPNFDKVRISMRVRESDKSLKRNELLGKINDHLASMEELKPATARVTGVFVLYNNMLQSLFGSQIKTIVAVYVAIWLMFLVLFRSPTLATIGIIPNILPVVLVLGTLGWLNIPLDIMTIMIAAITLGIAVDFAIHYIFRFKNEFPKDQSYVAAMYRCHASIGRAMYYTSITIVFGFSILMLSNFIPTLYFGAFTGLAMIIALLASVTLLPMLLILWKPLGPEKADS